MKSTSVYDKTVSYAREHNELEAFRTSKRENIACKNAISDAIRRNYDGSHINTKQALKELKENFSLERIAVVTAVTIRPRD